MLLMLCNIVLVVVVVMTMTMMMIMMMIMVVVLVLVLVDSFSFKVCVDSWIGWRDQNLGLEERKGDQILEAERWRRDCDGGS